MIFYWVLLIPFTSAASFWMTAELTRVDWKEGCLTTAGCSQPRFQLLEDMLPLNEKQSISWAISEHFVQDSARSLVTFWPTGRPEDVSLACQVVGTDPTYGFPRVCDQSASIRVFQQHIASAFERTRDRRHQTTPIPEEELGKHIVELRGKCFDATLTVQKHTERCPWCPDPSEVTLIGQEIPEEQSPLSSSILAHLHGEDGAMHFAMLVLAGIAIITSAAFAMLLVAFFKQKRNNRQITVKPRYQPYSPALVKITDDDGRYDMPWGEAQRNLAYWQSRSESSTTSPLDSGSSLGTAGRMFRPPQTGLYQTISPNSSLGARDSGLESV